VTRQTEDAQEHASRDVSCRAIGRIACPRDTRDDRRRHQILSGRRITAAGRCHERAIPVDPCHRARALVPLPNLTVVLLRQFPFKGSRLSSREDKWTTVNRPETMGRMARGCRPNGPTAVCYLWDRWLGAVYALSGHADRPRV